LLSLPPPVLRISLITFSGTAYPSGAMCFIAASAATTENVVFNNSMRRNDYRNDIFYRNSNQNNNELQSEKHRLTSKEAVDKINRKVSIDLQEFRAKVQSIDYQGLFNTDYDLAIGLLTHRLSIQFLNTIKYHHIHLIALPQSL
jgi:SLT domain-containing protein